MGSLLSFSLASSLVLVALYLPYKWLLSSENMPGQNRVTLLLLYLLSLISVPLFGLFERGGVGGDTVLFSAELVPVAAANDIGLLYSPWNIILCVYLAGILLLVVWGIVAFMRLRSLLRGTAMASVDGVMVYVSREEGIAPFSFGRRIVLPESDLTSPCLPLIVAHERVHISHSHWADLAVGYLVCLLQWYNPVSWLMLRELRAVHEFQADARVIDTGADMRDYQMLLIKKAVGHRFHSFADSLNHSNLKLRITMMYSQKPKGVRRWRALALVPALGAALFATDLSAVASALTGASAATIPVPVVSQGKVSENPETIQGDDAPMDLVEQMPEYPGGLQALMKFLGEYIVYPEAAKNANIEGRVVVRFVVDKTGKVNSPTVIKSVSPELDQAAIDVVSKMPAFSPGYTDGNPVSVYYVLPIQFSLSDKGPSETK
ncbi:MAG: M56 family metallopeptidase [Duncaniella sp.]|nr:M56 family metallopeptidase [Duncaniella sp.]